MKRLLFILVLSFFGSHTFAQTEPEAFIGLLPSFPGDACSMKLEQRTAFLNKLDSISELIRAELARRDQKMEANHPKVEKQIMNTMSQKYGLSAQDVQKLQSGGKISAAEKKALADKMLQNSMNISMGEVEALKKMDKEGKKAWAEAYSTEVMAEMQADPKKAQEKQLQDKNLYELTFMQKHLMDSIMAIEAKFGKQFQELENDPQRIAKERQIGKLERERDSLIGQDNGNRIEALNRNIKSLKQAYCNQYSPKNFGIISQYINYAKASLPACYRLEVIENKLTKAQTGGDLNIQPGTIGLSKVDSMFGVMSRVFKYNLMNGMDEE